MLTYDELEDVLSSVEDLGSTRLQSGLERTQARPGSQLQALVSNDGWRIEPFTWGFEAPWSKTLLFNTRIESALGGSSTWAEAIATGRCILPAASFFEPHRTEKSRNPHTGRQTMRQYEFTMPHGEPLLLASVHRNGRLSVVTTEPNSHVAPIHKRMPLALRFEEVPTWLGADFKELADRSLLSLIARPENEIEAGEEPAQLSLF